MGPVGPDGLQLDPALRYTAGRHTKGEDCSVRRLSLDEYGWRSRAGPTGRHPLVSQLMFFTATFIVLHVQKRLAGSGPALSQASLLHLSGPADPRRCLSPSRRAFRDGPPQTQRLQRTGLGHLPLASHMRLFVTSCAAPADVSASPLKDNFQLCNCQV